MSAINEHTGDFLVSKTSEAYRDNYDSIFRKKPQGCTRSHPHEDMSEDCEGLTVVAREKYYEALFVNGSAGRSSSASYKPHQNGFFPYNLKDDTTVKWPKL